MTETPGRQHERHGGEVRRPVDLARTDELPLHGSEVRRDVAETRPYDALAETMRARSYGAPDRTDTRADVANEPSGADAPEPGSEGDWLELGDLLATAGQGWTSEGLVPRIESQLAQRRRQRLASRMSCVLAMGVLFALGWAAAGWIEPPELLRSEDRSAATVADLPVETPPPAALEWARANVRWDELWYEVAQGDPAGRALEEYRDWEWIESSVALDLLARDAAMLTEDLGSDSF